MRRVGIIGGETHIGEITALRGQQLQIVGAAVRPDQAAAAAAQFDCPVVASYAELLQRFHPDLVAVANENDRRAEAIVAALQAGCDVVCDKPLAITWDQQRAVEEAVAATGHKLLNLLTLRGHPLWAALRAVVQSGRLGAPAFVHVRMAVQLKPAARPPWFLDVRRSGGLFLDLLIHGLDYVEWLTGQKIVAMSAVTGNLGAPGEPHLRDHASVFCELETAAAACDGQRMLPATRGSDYRVTVAGTQGFADLDMTANRVTVTDASGDNEALKTLPPAVSVVADWLAGGDLIPQEASLRANRLALWATEAAATGERIRCR